MSLLDASKKRFTIHESIMLIDIFTLDLRNNLGVWIAWSLSLTCGFRNNSNSQALT